MQWQRLLKGIDPTVLAVNKAVFSATFGCRRASQLLNGQLYQDKYLVKDILNYRAAAMAVKLYDEVRIENESLEVLRDWRNLYAPDGQAYTSLNKTLMNLPGGVPLGVLKDLRKLVLPRPIYNRVELIATLSATGGLADNCNVVAFANGDQIRSAMQRVSRYLHRPLSPRRWRHVAEAIRFILDYPERHSGNIVGLANKSIRWHRQRLDQVAHSVIVRLGKAKELAKPPIKLPEDEGICFLETVGALVKEDCEMNNCISGYAQRAVGGSCYLFHIDHKGQRASVEVDSWGRVRQSYGPQNTLNAASKWGEQVLTRWGQAFPMTR
jgi:hypothetical protein